MISVTIIGLATFANDK